MFSAVGGSVDGHADKAAGGRLPSLRRDLWLFAVLAVLGTAACYLSVQIPHTDVNIDGRQFFGLIGFALLARWWLALALAAVLSYFGFHHDLPTWVCFVGNMLYMVPQAFIFRTAQRHWLSRIHSLPAYGLAWFALVIASYEVVVMPAIWLVVGILEGQPLLGSVLSAWQGQPLLFEAIAIGVMSALAMAAYRSHKQRVAGSEMHSRLVNTMPEGVAVHEIIVDQNGKPCDYRFISVNPAFERLTGLNAKEIIGRTVLETLPGTERYWIDTYGKIAQEGGTVAFEQFSSEIDKHFSVTAYQPQNGQFVVVFSDITSRVKAEEELRQQSEELTSLNQELSATNDELEAQYEELEQTHSELTESQQDLRASESKFRLLAENLPGVVYQCNADERWTVRFINDYVEKLTGYPAEKFYGGEVSMPGLSHPDDLARVDSECRAAIAEGRTFHLVYRITHASGALRWVEEWGEAVRDSSGEALYIEGYLQDVTDRKLAEQELADSHELVQLLSDASFESIFLSDKGVCLGQNATARRMFGYSDAEALGKMGTEWITPEDRERVLHNMLSGYSEPYRVAALRKDGSTFPAEINARMVQFRGRQIRVTALRDLSAEEKAISDLRDSEERFKLLYNAVQAGVVVHQQDGEIIHANEVAAEIFTMPQDQVTGRDPSDTVWNLVDENHRPLPVEMQPAMQTLATGEPVHNFVLGLYANNPAKMRWLLVNSVLLSTDADGKPDEVLVTFLDITQLRKVELDLTEQHEFLELLIRHNPNAIAVFDTEMRYIYVSERFVADYELADHDIIGKTHYEVFPEIPERWRMIHARVLTGETFTDDNDYFDRPDGSRTYVSWNCRPWYKADGSIGGSIMYTEVITARKEAEQQLAESKERLDLALEGAGLGSWDWDIPGNHVVYSQRWAQMLGYTLDELNALDDPWVQFVHPDDREVALSRLNAHLRRDNEIYESRHRLRCKDGSYIWVLDRGKVIRFGQDGEPMRAAGTQLDITEQVEREEIQASLMDVAMDGIWIADMDGWLLSVNQAAADMLGYTPEEMAGKHIAEVDLDFSVEDVKAKIRSHLVDKNRRFDSRHQHKDGSILRVDVSFTVLPRAGGRCIVFIHDVTSRRRTEEQLRFQAAILDQISDSVTATDLDGYITYVNQANCAMHGIAREQFLGNNVQLFGDDPESDASQQDLIRLTLRDGSWRGILVNAVEGGRRIFLDTRLQLLHDENGEPQGMFGVSTDITERREAERKLMESQQNLLRAQTVAHVGDWQLDMRTLQFTGSQESRRIYGFYGDEWDVQDVIKAPLPEYREMMDEALTSLVESGKEYDVEFKIKRANDGEIRDIHSVAEFNNEKQVVFGVIQDITERKRDEDERLRLEDQLRQSHKMEALGVLAGGIAHDFNNILFGIIGFADLLGLEVEGNPGAEEYLQGILANSQRAAGLVKQILTFARKTERCRSSNDIVPLCKETLKLLRSTIPAGIELRTNLSVPHAFVVSDPTEIHQVLMNLCTNAAQAVSESGGLIEVSLDDLRPGGKSSGTEQSPRFHYRLCVRDNGPGILDDVLDRIFDPFFTTKGVGEGTGMGLAVVHGIVENLGGLVKASNNASGPGACLTVYLPAANGDSEGEQPRGDAGRLPRGSEHVLVVDDEPAITLILDRLLSSLGYQVTCCSSGTDALEKFAADPELFDIVVTDQSMPRLSGAELLVRLRGLRADIPVVVMTGFSRQLSDSGSRQLGFSAMLSKPLSRERLAQTVRVVLDREKG